jgi:hypothetical protein
MALLPGTSTESEPPLPALVRRERIATLAAQRRAQLGDHGRGEEVVPRAFARHREHFTPVVLVLVALLSLPRE